MALETPARLEPCGLEEAVPSALLELVHELQSAAKDLGTRLNTGVAAELRGMMRIANAQHSNRIEGRIAEPTDIERALAGRWADVEHSDMVQEIVAHVHVQAWIDAQAAQGTLPAQTSAAFIQELHRRLYDRMPSALRVAEHGHLSREIHPGIFRGAGHDVTVGAHMPPSGHRIAAFMAYFERRYSGLTCGTTGLCLAIPAAHHRLSYIHPFDDGNGRVCRLMTHAMIHAAELDGQGLWSVSRGLARGLEDTAEYKQRLAAADQPRRGDRDGRGNLSLAMLESFALWFLQVMQAEIRFATALFDPAAIAARYRGLLRDLYPERPQLPRLVDLVLRQGEVTRDQIHSVLDPSVSVARSDIDCLLHAGLLKSTSPAAPLRLACPLAYHERLFPHLFCDDA